MQEEILLSLFFLLQMFLIYNFIYLFLQFVLLVRGREEKDGKEESKYNLMYIIIPSQVLCAINHTADNIDW